MSNSYFDRRKRMQNLLEKREKERKFIQSFWKEKYNNLCSYLIVIQFVEVTKQLE